MTSIIGISCYYHDSAAALVKDGKIIAAVQEERFTRVKNDPSFPTNSIKYILKSNKTKLSDIDHIVFYEKPFLKFSRILETYLANAPFGFTSFKRSIPLWVKDKLFQKQNIINELKKIDKFFNKKILFSDHHLSHAASAFYPSPFRESLIITLDAVGEYTTTSISIGKENKIFFKKKINYPHSLGMLYSAFTYYCGFKVNEGEYKLMGLAPYGKPKYEKIILDNLISFQEDGSFQLNMNYFDFSTGLKMINSKFEKLFKRNTRDPKKEDLEIFHMDIASSVQKVLEIIVLRICEYFKDHYKIKNLSLAGGVALNCVLNGKILDTKLFEDIWIQPAAGDAGGALGAALSVWYHHLGNERKLLPERDSMNGSFLGPSFTNVEIKKELDELNIKYDKLSDEKIYDTVSDLIINGNLIGWFQDALEFGPRALGNRSIIADPRSPTMQKKINMKIKFREGFRPFAPAILNEKSSEFFVNNNNNPYMLVITQLKDELKKNTEKLIITEGFKKLNVLRSDIQAVTHVDYSARVQSVFKDTNKKFYLLINKFYEKTGCPILVNTSFNVNNEPIVCTVKDAYNCFKKTDLDYLVCGNFLIKKTN